MWANFQHSLEGPQVALPLTHINGVLVIYCCIMNHPKTYWLITTTINFVYEYAIWVELGGEISSLLISWGNSTRAGDNQTFQDNLHGWEAGVIC